MREMEEERREVMKRIVESEGEVQGRNYGQGREKRRGGGRDQRGGRERRKTASPVGFLGAGKPDIEELAEGLDKTMNQDQGTTTRKQNRSLFMTCTIDDSDDTIFFSVYSS